MKLLRAVVLFSALAALAVAANARRPPVIDLPVNIPMPDFTTWPPPGRGPHAGASGPAPWYLPSPDTVISLTVDRLQTMADSAPLPRRPIAAYLIFPTEMKRAGVNGQVTVRVQILEDGSVKTVKVLRANIPEFADAVMRKLPRYRFAPATQAGQAVACVAVCTVTFTLFEDY
jgi:TonB family protein